MTPGQPTCVRAELITGALRAEPRRIGKVLRAPFDAEGVARRSTYWIRYRVDDERALLAIVDVHGRADVGYRP